MNGRQSTLARARRSTRSITSPKRIIAAFTPNRAISAIASVTPASIAISTTISEALTEYSHQRAGLTPRETFA